MNTLFLVTYALFLFIFIWIGRFKQRQKNKLDAPSIGLFNLTVIIPYRNEEENLIRLIQCFENSNFLPGSIILINDHSTDGGEAILNSFSKKLPFTLLSLNTSMGKKAALHMGIGQVTTPWVLTMDADVTFEPNFFTHLGELPQSDMWILPVVMTGGQTWRSLFEIDFQLINAFNASFYGWHRPILASGANLLFSKVAYHEAEDHESHAHISSGDDMFLLRDFRMAHKSVQVNSESNLAVFTNSPKSGLEFINQRIRWVSKSHKVNDAWALSFGLVQTFISLVFYVLLISSVCASKWSDAAYLISVKSAIDLLVYFSYFKRMKRLFAWLFIPVQQLLFPIYNVLLLLLIPFYKPSWKDRRIKV